MDFAIARALGHLIKQNQEPVAEAAMLKMREQDQSNSILSGRHMIWLILDHFKADNTSAGQQQLVQPPMKLETDTCRSSAAPA